MEKNEMAKGEDCGGSGGSGAGSRLIFDHKEEAVTGSRAKPRAAEGRQTVRADFSIGFAYKVVRRPLHQWLVSISLKGCASDPHWQERYRDQERERTKLTSSST